MGQFQVRFGSVFSRLLEHLTEIWEKESIHRPAPVQNFSLQKKRGPQRKDFGGGYGFLVSIGFCIHNWPGKFFFAARKVPQKIFFRWWLCTLFPSLEMDLKLTKNRLKVDSLQGVRWGACSLRGVKVCG